MFTRSKFIADKVVISADMVRAKFANSFSVENGVVVARDGQGGHIMSRARPGEVADFEEAIEALIGAYPHRDQVMRGGAGRGTGAHAGNGVAGKRSRGSALGQTAAVAAAGSAHKRHKADRLAEDCEPDRKAREAAGQDRPGQHRQDSDGGEDRAGFGGFPVVLIGAPPSHWHGVYGDRVTCAPAWRAAIVLKGHFHVDLRFG